ncbi:MAG TPA: sigma factor-like helix-turn-helix DNA-binding protein [Ktedonobacterales bacterium]|nr:sigma factor-like helix-turn-helix DNA-binding protein [Ktedonobacterales bacterium]
MAGARTGLEAGTPAAELVRLAHARLAAELETLAPWDTPLLWARLRARAPQQAVSLGALAHCIRLAARAGDQRAARELFVRLLERTEALNARWARRTVARTTGLFGAAGEQVREDLRQELTLRLWEHIVVHDGEGGEGWELFFQRALDYAQRHVAGALMRQHGYWPGTAAGASGERARLVPALLASLDRLPDEDAPITEVDALADSADQFSAADLADLRALVTRLPAHERLTVVLRYWDGASEAEIARALGGVTTRTVRNYLRRACARLRGWYEAAEATG